MSIITLTQKEAPLLTDFCSTEIMENIGKPKFFTFGYFDDEDFMDGIIQFSIITKNPNQYIGVINHIFVQEIARNDGIGYFLLDQCMAILRESTIEQCMVMLDTESAEYASKGFFQNFGFHFSNTITLFYKIPIETVLKSKLVKRDKNYICKSINDFSQKEFSTFFKSLDNDSTTYISENLSDYERNISSYYMTDSGRGLFLIKKNDEKNLQIVFLGTKGKNSSLQLQLFSYSAKEMQKIYGNDVIIHISSLNRDVHKLIEYTCPNILPSKMESGYMTII